MRLTSKVSAQPHNSIALVSSHLVAPVDEVKHLLRDRNSLDDFFSERGCHVAFVDLAPLERAGLVTTMDGLDVISAFKNHRPKTSVVAVFPLDTRYRHHLAEARELGVAGAVSYEEFAREDIVRLAAEPGADWPTDHTLLSQPRNGFPLAKEFLGVRVRRIVLGYCAGFRSWTEMDQAFGRSPGSSRNDWDSVREQLVRCDPYLPDPPKQNDLVLWIGELREYFHSYFRRHPHAYENVVEQEFLEHFLAAPRPDRRAG
ncbi:MAG TPA: hypothetical protein VGX28_12325 [Frankiaceae bacterium]|jgi:hypothetical protein|nr:hypothetical protein [Frankiaceae bacterium]